MKKLTLSTKDKKIAGVCGGIAEYFNIDSTIVRLGFLLTLTPGGIPGIVLYLAAWIIIPEETSSNNHKKEESDGKK